MKKNLVATLAVVGMLLLLCGSVQADLNDGLVAYYPFNGNANDESGNGNNGTVNGATLTTDRSGNMNSAYNFDGVNNFIRIPHSSSLTLSAFTISLWFKWSDFGTDNIRFLIAKGLENFELHTGGQAGINGLRFIPACGLTGNPTPQLDITNSLSSNWTQVIAIYGSGNAFVYLDGVLFCQSKIIGASDILSDTNPFSIGARGNNGYPFKGQIDDVRIYNRALSKSEVQELYNEDNGNCPTIYDPVCGIDGETYFNACFADQAGVEVNYTGECVQCSDKYDAGKDFCINNPEECGLYSESYVNTLNQQCTEVLGELQNEINQKNEMINSQATAISSLGATLLEKSNADANTANAIKKIVQDAIDQAKDEGGKEKELQHAEKKIDSAQKEIEAIHPDYDKAIKYYEKAWDYIQKSMQ